MTNSTMGSEGLTLLATFISDIQKNIHSGLFRTATAGIATNSSDIDDGNSTMCPSLRGRALNMHSDFTYVVSRIDLNDSSQNSIISKNILNVLLDVPTTHSATNFTLGSTNLNQLLQIILKLKLLVPRKIEDWRHTENILGFAGSNNQEGGYSVNQTQGTMDLHSSNYKSLTETQKNCVLCFSAFPCSAILKRLIIKKRVLIHWWIGEGFIDPRFEKKDSRRVSTTEGVEKPSTADEIGSQIMKVLEDKGFIEPVLKNGKESGSCCMQPLVHSFVTTRAKEEGFFDFNKKSGNLTPCFSRSKRACLLASHGNIPPSNVLWDHYTHFPKRLISFQNVRTLFNVNESAININGEWFSRMNLNVLHLGNWQPENVVDIIKVVDQSFLKYLKNMRKLRFVNLRGLSAITKLPDSICQLTNLRILDLRGCSFLEGLPADIGSLKNLAYLDITHCRLLSNLPKGIRLLSKLEVLKGFIITHQDGARQHGKVFILEDLLNLGKLSKLSLFVKVKGFPNNQDLRVLKEMKNLCRLQITWETDFVSKREESMIEKEVPKGSVWRKWGGKVHRLRQNDKEETSTSQPQSNIRKLVLSCIPNETARCLLDPSEWEKLEELHISGDELTELPRGANDKHTWNVKTLCLKDLRDISWVDLGSMFPHLTYLEVKECPNLKLFPCDANGIWRKEP